MYRSLVPDAWSTRKGAQDPATAMWESNGRPSDKNEKNLGAEEQDHMLMSIKFTCQSFVFLPVALTGS